MALKRMTNKAYLAQLQRAAGPQTSSRTRIQLTPINMRAGLAESATTWKKVTQGGQLSKRDFRQPGSSGTFIAITKIGDKLVQLAHIVKDEQLIIQYYCPTGDHRRLAYARAKSLAAGSRAGINTDQERIAKRIDAEHDKGTAAVVYWANQIPKGVVRVTQGRKAGPKKKVSGTARDKKRKRKLKDVLTARSSRNPRRKKVS